MAAWKINDGDLRTKWERIAGTPPGQQELHLAHAIANRLARDDDDGTEISPYEVLREVQKAAEDPRHFLHLPPRQFTATTLVTLLSLSSKRPVKHDPSLIRKVSQSDGAWALFLGNFFNDHVSGWDRFLIGGWGMAAKANQYGVLAAETLFGGASFLVNAGDSVDVRINVLATKAVTIAEGLHKKLRVSSRLPEINEACSHLARVLSESKSDNALVERIRNNGKILADLHVLLEFIVMHGKKRVSLEALEALIALHTDVYERRSLHPVGQVTDSFPTVDGTDRGQVMSFLRTLGIVPRVERQADRAWQFWQEAWNQREINAEDVGWDMDRTLYQYKLHLLSGEEYLRMDPVIIKLVALALRDKRPNIVVSNAIRARIADFANHPALAAFRFAFFLRMPSDPPITVEEIASMPNVSSYEELMDERIHSMNSLLRDPVETLRRAERLLARSHSPDGEVDEDLVAAARTLLQSVVRGPAWEGVKFAGGLRRHKKVVPMFLVDDNRSHVRDFVKSDGLGGVVVPYLERQTEGLYVPDHPVFDPFTVLVGLVRRIRSHPEVKQTILPLDKEKHKIGSREDFPPLDVHLEHSKWGWKVWEGWVRAGRVMVFTKIQLVAKLLWARKLKQANEEAAALFGAAPGSLAAQQLTVEALAEPEPPAAADNGNGPSVGDAVIQAIAAAQAKETPVPPQAERPAVADGTADAVPPALTPAGTVDDEVTAPGGGPPAGEDDGKPKAALTLTVEDRSPLRIGDQEERPRFDGTAALALRPHPANVFPPMARDQEPPSLRVVREGPAAPSQADRLRQALIHRALMLDLQQVPGFLAKLPDESLRRMVTSRAGLVQILEKRGLGEWAGALRSSSVPLTKADIVLMVAAAATGSREDLGKLAAKTGLLQSAPASNPAVNPAILTTPAAAAGRVILLLK